MYCDNCGSENRESANFCYKCGTALCVSPGGEKKNAPAALEDNSQPPAKIDENISSDDFARLLNGRYELKKLLGRGGMGIVYHAYDKKIGMDVAIKFILHEFADNFTAVESLKREAKATMRLAHPNIVRLYNFEDTPHVKYVLMEYVRGESLCSLVAQRPGRRLSEPEVMRYMCEVCNALTYAHRENIVHRDIKPSNILVAEDGRVKLTDFGIALINEKVEAEPEDVVAGTPSYMSPEQILGQPLDGRSDIYSLGVTMYEMLAGRLPFRGRDSQFRYISMLPDPIEGISDWLNAIIVKCLRKEPDGRWISAEELKDVLTGKKEGGLALKAKFQPWWIVAEDLKKNEPAKQASAAPAAEEPPKEVEQPEYLRAEVQRKPLPSSSARRRERVENVERYADLLEYASEREQARVAYATIAGIAAGVLFFLLSGSVAANVLPGGGFLRLSFVLYGASLGIAVALAHRKLVRGALSFSFGILGGILAALLMQLTPAVSLIEMQASQNLLVCGAVIGMLLGMADGIYYQSFAYLARCAFWGAVGGAAGSGGFLMIRYALSSFWSPLPHWTVLGAALGFSTIMAIGLAKKPAIREQMNTTR